MKRSQTTGNIGLNTASSLSKLSQSGSSKKLNQAKEEKDKSKRSKAKSTTSDGYAPWGTNEVGSTDYIKRLIYDNETIHKKFQQLEVELTELEQKSASLSNEYNEMKRAYINLKTRKKRVSRPSREVSSGGNEDNTDDIETVRMLLELEQAQKHQLIEGNKALEKELENLRSESTVASTKQSNLESLMKLQNENKELRSLIKRMSELMTPNDTRSKMTVSLMLQHKAASTPYH